MFPMINKVARHVRGEQHLSLLDRAYHHPEFVTPDRTSPADRERRHANGQVVVVSRGTGMALFIGTYDQCESSQQIAETAEPKRRKKGGSGTRAPTSIAEVVSRLQLCGCQVEDTGQRYRVSVPGSGVRFLPHSAGNWRTMRNIVTKFRQLGIDLSRPGT